MPESVKLEVQTYFQRSTVNRIDKNYEYPKQSNLKYIRTQFQRSTVDRLNTYDHSQESPQSNSAHFRLFSDQQTYVAHYSPEYRQGVKVWAEAGGLDATVLQGHWTPCALSAHPVARYGCLCDANTVPKRLVCVMLIPFELSILHALANHLCHVNSFCSTRYVLCYVHFFLKYTLCPSQSPVLYSFLLDHTLYPSQSHVLC